MHDTMRLVLEQGILKSNISFSSYFSVLLLLIPVTSILHVTLSDIIYTVSVVVLTCLMCIPVFPSLRFEVHTQISCHYQLWSTHTIYSTVVLMHAKYPTVASVTHELPYLSSHSTTLFIIQPFLIACFNRICHTHNLTLIITITPQPSSYSQ
jgi:hypothetical protein